MTKSTEENAINGRIADIIEALNISANAFAQKLDVAGSVIYNILKGRNKPSFDILDKIVSSFDISPNYLLTGQGDIFASNEEINEIESLRGSSDEDYAFFLKQWDRINRIVDKVGKKDTHSYFEGASWSLMKIAEVTNHYSLMEQSINFLRFAPKNIDNETLTTQVAKMLEFEEELSKIIKPYEVSIAKLFRNISDFNEKHDNLYHMDDDYLENLLKEVDKEMNTPKSEI